MKVVALELEFLKEVMQANKNAIFGIPLIYLISLIFSTENV